MLHLDGPARLARGETFSKCLALALFLVLMQIFLYRTNCLDSLLASSRGEICFGSVSGRFKTSLLLCFLEKLPENSISVGHLCCFQWFCFKRPLHHFATLFFCSGWRGKRGRNAPAAAGIENEIVTGLVLREA
jgi:hypothetical protein